MIRNTAIRNETRRLILAKSRWLRGLGHEIAFALKDVDPRTRASILRAAAKAITNPSDSESLERALQGLGR